VRRATGVDTGFALCTYASPLLAETLLFREAEASIVEHIAFRFAIISFDKSDQLQPVRKAELRT
jgi:hypothetical protein